LNDLEHAKKDIVDLLRYDENRRGLMGKELLKENWNVLTCVKEMRIQAENVSSTFYLCGR
jgi:magnesium transporter